MFTLRFKYAEAIFFTFLFFIFKSVVEVTVYGVGWEKVQSKWCWVAGSHTYGNYPIPNNETSLGQNINAQFVKEFIFYLYNITRNILKRGQKTAQWVKDLSYTCWVQFWSLTPHKVSPRLARIDAWAESGVRTERYWVRSTKTKSTHTCKHIDINVYISIAYCKIIRIHYVFTFVSISLIDLY